MLKRCCSKVAVLTLCVVFFTSFYGAGYSEKPVFDWYHMQVADLTALRSDIYAEYNLHHSVSSAQEDEILTIVKKETANYYYNKKIDISWAWYGSEYKYTRDMDYFTLDTHIDYKDSNNKNRQVKVKSELLLNGDSFSLVYLKTDDAVIIDEKSSLPADLYINKELATVNEKSGTNLSLLTSQELTALEKDVNSAITSYHTVDSRDESEVKKAVKREVEHYFSNEGIEVSWPWSDFTYTCDWGCYTEKTRIDYKKNSVFHDDDRVYAEVYRDGLNYEVCYLTIADQVIIDKWDQINSENKSMYFNSRTYAQAVSYREDGKYEDAYKLFVELGEFDDSASQAQTCKDYSNQQVYEQASTLKEGNKLDEAAELFESISTYLDSEQQAKECRDLITDQTYERAVALQNEGDYEAAILIFTELGEYKDSAERIIKCNTGILEEKYQNAVAMMSEGKYEEAILAFTEIHGYSESNKRIDECNAAITERDYQAALSTMEAGEYEKAISMFQLLGDYSESKEKIQACEEAILQRTYDQAKAFVDEGKFTEALNLFKSLADYKDSEEQAGNLQDIIASINREIIISESEYTVFQGKNTTFEATVKSLTDEAPESTKLSFTAGDKNIVGIAANGTITGKAPGDTFIRVSASDNSYIFKDIVVHVVKSVNKVTLGTRSTELFIPTENGNDTFELAYEIEPADAYNKEVVWSSSNDNVATVDENGLVKAVGIGKANITITCEDDTKGKKTAVCNVTVSQAVTSITLNEDEGSVIEGKQIQIKATVEPKNAKNKKISWSSSNEAIATVNANGQIKGISTGTAVITAKSDDGPSARYTINVEQNPANRPFIVTFNDFKSRFSKAVSTSGSKHKLSNPSSDNGIVNDVTTYYVKDYLALQLSFPKGTKNVRSAMVLYAPGYVNEDTFVNFLNLCCEVMYATKVTNSYDSSGSVFDALKFWDNVDDGDRNSITINGNTVGYSISSTIGAMFYVEVNE